MKLYYNIILIIIISFLLYYYKEDKDDKIIESQTNYKPYNLKFNVNKFNNNLNIAIYNSISNIKKLHILSKYIPLNIYKYNNYLDIINENIELIVIREYLINKNDKYKFVCGFNYEYFFLLTSNNYNNLSDLKTINSRINIGVNSSDKQILEILLKISNISNYNLIVEDNNKLFNSFYMNEIEFIFKITDEKDIAIFNLSNLKNFKVLNIDVSFEIFNKTIKTVYKRNIPKYVILNQGENTNIQTYCIRNIIVSNNTKNNNELNILLEVIHYYNSEIIDEYNSFLQSNLSYKFNTEFLNKNDLSYILYLEYHPTSVKYFKKKNLIKYKYL